jgi:hypothetical protein
MIANLESACDRSPTLRISATLHINDSRVCTACISAEVCDFSQIYFGWDFKRIIPQDNVYASH